jgi:hypothetical protein
VAAERRFDAVDHRLRRGDAVFERAATSSPVTGAISSQERAASCNNADRATSPRRPCAERRPKFLVISGDPSEVRQSRRWAVRMLLDFRIHLIPRLRA